MNKLRDLQQQFMRDILSGTAQGRANVYANNIMLTLRDHLDHVFPVTRLLLGDDFMHQTCDAMVKSFPPSSGDLALYGADLADILAHHPGMRDYPFVPDTARLEWLLHESALSAMVAPLHADDLAAIADPLNMTLQLQPHARLLRSGWPVDKVWQKIGEQGAALKDFTIKPDETFIVLYRQDDKIAIRPIGEGAYKFLEYLQTDTRFAFAAQAAMMADSTLALDHVLAGFVAEGLFIGKNTPST